MPIAIQVHKGSQRYRPVVICDQCGEQITDAKDGNYEWRADQGEWTEYQIYFTHKKCCHAFEMENGDPSMWLAGELAHFMLYLGNNLNLDIDSARETAAQLSLI